MLEPFDVATAAPQITYAYRDLEEVDDPARIRWRAMWDSNYNDGLPGGIYMQCYPVVRKTSEAAWIDPHAYRLATKQPWEEGAPAYEWNLSDPSNHKLVYDRSGSAWAKPTRAEALRSLGVRLTRWSVKVERDVKRVNAACDVAAALLSAPTWKDAPDHALFLDSAPASAHKIRLAQEDSPLAVALRRLKWQYERGAMERCDHVEAVLKEFAG